MKNVTEHSKLAKMFEPVVSENTKSNS